MLLSLIQSSNLLEDSKKYTTESHNRTKENNRNLHETTEKNRYIYIKIARQPVSLSFTMNLFTSHDYYTDLWPRKSSLTTIYTLKHVINENCNTFCFFLKSRNVVEPVGSVFKRPPDHTFRSTAQVTDIFEFDDIPASPSYLSSQKKTDNLVQGSDNVSVDGSWYTVLAEWSSNK